MNEDPLKEARMAVRNAQEVRAYHRRRTARNDPQRKRDIQMALTRVKEAMRPLRSELGRLSHISRTPRSEARYNKLKDHSAALQRERRKLWKMLNRKENK